MFRTFTISLAFFVFATFSALAENCRWVTCSPDMGITTKQLHSYIYGNTRDVEPWSAEAMKKPVRKKSPVKPQSVESPLPSKSSGTAEIRLLDNVPDEVASDVDETNVEETGIEDIGIDETSIDEDLQYGSVVGEGLLDFTPAEEAAVRAYLKELDKDNSIQREFGTRY